MFIASQAFVRKHGPWILGLILFVSVGMGILFSGGGIMSNLGGSRSSNTNVPTIGGKPVNAKEYEQARNCITALQLLTTGKMPSHTARFEDELTQEAVMRTVLLKKAAELGILVGDDELVRQIRSQRMFVSENKQFDPERYRRTIIFLNNYGISESEFEDIMRQEITLARLQALISSGAKVTPMELSLMYKPLHEKNVIDLVELDAADQKQPATITDDDAKAYYDQNKESFRIPAQVKVRYVLFTTADAKKSVRLTDQEIADFYERNQAHFMDTNDVAKPLDSVKSEIREELLAALAERDAADRATAMTTNLVFEASAPRPDFAKVAAQFGVTPHDTGYFGLHDTVTGINAGLQFNQEAFALDPKERPFSDPVAGKDGYYVLEYLDSKPSEIPPLEQVKDKVVKELKEQRAYDATIKRGQDAVAEVKKAMAAGKTFPDACAQLKLKYTTPEPFSYSDKIELPALASVQRAVLSMPTNSVSEFIPTTKGGVFFYLKQRMPPDPAEFEKDKPQFAEQILERNRQALFQDWMRNLIAEEQINFGPRRSQPPSAEQPGESEPEPAPASEPPPS